MRTVRASSIEEYARWYLRRDRRKHPGAVMDEADELRDPVEVMRQKHPGKMRDWFSDDTRCSIVRLDSLRDLENLVFLESQWTRSEGLVVPGKKNYRLLLQVAENAIEGGYFARHYADKHREHYDRLASNSLRIEGEDRVAICSAEKSEILSNPAAQYYLLDGTGRCLAYMALVFQRLKDFTPIEAFRIEAPEDHLATPHGSLLERQVKEGREFLAKYRRTLHSLAK